MLVSVSDMGELSKLEHVADMIIKRVLVEVRDFEQLPQALLRANPCGSDPDGRRLWIDALFRNGMQIDTVSQRLRSPGGGPLAPDAV
jgi:hypothetical protein